jgi:hypothetical protein
MDVDASILAEEPEFTLATHHNVLVWCFRGKVTRARIDRSSDVLADLAARYPRGIADMTIIGPGISMLVPADARERAVEISARFRASLVAIATVVDGSGFLKATARSIVGVMQSQAELDCPREVFATVHEAAPWLARHAAVGGAVDLSASSLASVTARVLRGR